MGASFVTEQTQLHMYCTQGVGGGTASSLVFYTSSHCFSSHRLGKMPDLRAALVALAKLAEQLSRCIVPKREWYVHGHTSGLSMWTHTYRQKASSSQHKKSKTKQRTYLLFGQCESGILQLGVS